jgi:hypothetical protein
VRFDTPNDDTAFEHARQFVNGCDVELWSDQRLVARQESIDAQAARGGHLGDIGK